MVAADIIADIDKPSVLTECLPQRITGKRMFQKAVTVRRKLVLAFFVVQQCQNYIGISNQLFQDILPKLQLQAEQFNIQLPEF